MKNEKSRIRIKKISVLIENFEFHIDRPAARVYIATTHYGLVKAPRFRYNGHIRAQR